MIVEDMCKIVSTLILPIFLPSVCATVEYDRVMNRFALDALMPDGIGRSPSSVAAFLCSDKENLIYLTKLASRRGILINVKHPLQELDGEIFSRDLDHHRSYYLLQLGCPGAIDILHRANSAGMFRGPSKWLLLQDLRGDDAVTDPKTSPEMWIYDLFKDLAVLPDSGVVIGQLIDTEFVRLISIYKPSNVGELIVEDLGYWRGGKGVSLNSTHITSVRRKDLRRTPLKSCLVMTDPESINHLTDFVDRHIDPITKANYPWILYLVEMMNATVTFTTVDSWGYRGSNGTWNGMLGMLDRKEIDIGGTALFLTYERMDIIQYVSLYTVTSARFIFRRPPLSYVSNIFVLPFHSNVWLATGIFLGLVAGLSCLAWKWEWFSTPEEQREEPHWAGPMPRISWTDNLLIMIGAVTQQGSTFEPRGVSPRIIILMLFVAVISLYTSYSANIVALLQSTTKSINSLESLLHSSMKVGVEDIVYNRHYFTTFQDPVRKAIYERKVAPKGQKPGWMSMEEGVRRMREGLFAFHGECGSVYKLMQEIFYEGEKCGFEEIDYLKVIDPMLSIQKRSPYLEIIKVGVLKLRESGLQNRIMRRLYTKKPTCQGQTNFISVGLVDCYAAFAILGWGSLVALLVLLSEAIWRRRKQSSADDSGSIHCQTMQKSVGSNGQNSPDFYSDSLPHTP